MNLKLKKGADPIVDNTNTPHPNAVIKAIRTSILHGRSLEIVLGLFHDKDSLQSNALRTITWNFSKEAEEPSFEQTYKDGKLTKGAMISTGHGGAAASMALLDITFDDVTTDQEKAKAFILAQKDWNGNPLGDTWEFES